MGSSSAIRAGAAFVELKSKDSDFIRGMRRAQRKLQAFGEAARRIGLGLVAGGGSITAAGAIAARVFASMGDQLDKMSARTGFSVEALAGLGFAAEQSGASIETLEKGIRAMQRSIFDAGRGLSTQTDALEKLGLTYEDLANLSPERQFEVLADRLSQVSDPTTRAAIAMTLFGRAGQQLIPLLSGGSQGIAQLRKQAEDLGIVFSADAARSAAELTDTLNIAKRTIKALVFEVGAALAPGIIKATKAVASIVAGTTRWVRNNHRIVRVIAAVAGGVVALGTLFLGLGLAAGVVAFAIGGLITIIGALGAAVGIVGSVFAALLSPIGLVIAAIVGIGTATLALTTDIGGMADTLLSVFKKLGRDVFGVVGDIVNAITAGDLELAMKITTKAIELVWVSMIERLKNTWSNFTSAVMMTMGAAIAGMGFTDAGLKMIVDNAPNGPDPEGQEEIRRLTEELRMLREKKPESIFGPDSSQFRSMLEQLQIGDGLGDQVNRSASGVFASNALRNLATPEDKAIETNTKITYETLQEMLRLLRLGGGLVIG